MLYVFAVHNNIEAPPAGIDFRGAFRILNISELHQRNWYLAQYIPTGKNREHLFSWLSEQHVLPWTPLILKKVRRTDKVCGYRRHIHAVFPGYFFLKADPESHSFTHLRRHSAFLDFVKMAGEIKTVRGGYRSVFDESVPGSCAQSGSRGGAGCCLHPLADKSALPVPPPA
nr:hypothetical protein [Shigella sonnei]